MKKGYFRFIWASALALASCSLQTATGGWYGGVKGSVQFEGGDMQGVEVLLRSTEDMDIPLRTAELSAVGEFFFDRVESGSYEVKASAENSCEASLVQGLTVTDGIVTLPAFKFTPLKEDSLPTDFKILLASDSTTPVARSVTVTVECLCNSSITVLRYAAGLHARTFFESGYGTLLLCKENKSSVQIVQNGIYTFYAKTADGKIGMQTVSISSIDMISPDPVQDIRAAFNSNSGKLEVEWKPSLSDDVQFLEVNLSGNGLEKTLTLAASKNSCSFDCEPDGAEYEVSVCAIDVAGNRSPCQKTKFFCRVEPFVYEAWFDREKVLYTEESATLFIRGSNFTKAEKDFFVVQLEEENSVPASVTVLDSSRASCSLSVPKQKGSYGAKIIYRDKVLFETSFTVCENPCINKIQVEPERVRSGKVQSVLVSLLGTDLDLCSSGELFVFNGEEKILTVSALAFSSECLKCRLDAPLEEGEYKLSCALDQKEQTVQGLLCVYDGIKISSVDECHAPLFNGGKNAEVIIRGKNLDTEENAIVLTCNGSSYSPHLVTESECRVNITVPVISSPKDFELTVFVNGEDSGVKGLLHVMQTVDYVDSMFPLVTVCSSQVSVDKKGTHLSQGQKISAYRLGRYQVTQGLWSLVYQWAILNGYKFSRSYPKCAVESLLPLTEVSWRDAIVWCNAFTEWHNANSSASQKLTCVYYSDAAFKNPLRESSSETSLLTSAGSIDNPRVKSDANGYRLPSAGEWEYAFRGASSNGDWDKSFSGSNDIDEVAWSSVNSGGILHEVGRKKANALGLYDMSGNIWEWTGDWLYSNVTRLLCGGSFKSSAEECGPQDKGLGKIPYYSQADWGFRLARKN